MSEAPIPAPPPLPSDYVPAEEILALIGQTQAEVLARIVEPVAPTEEDTEEQS